MTYQNSSNNRDINQPVNTQSGTTYVALLSDTIIAMSNAAARQVTLPAPSASGITSTVGKVYTVKDVAGTAATANITVTPAGGFIDGGTGVLIATNYGSASFYSDGTAWYSQAANYAAGVALAVAGWAGSSNTTFTPGTTTVQQSIAQWNTVGNAASRLQLSASPITQTALQNITLTNSGTTIQFSQAGTYLINVSDCMVESAGGSADISIQLVKNGTTILEICPPYILSSTVPTAIHALDYVGNFLSTDFVDIRYVTVQTGTFAWRNINVAVTQVPSSAIPSLAGNTPTQNIQTFTSSGTYTPSANLQYAIVEVVGGGGGSGGTAACGVVQVSSGAGGGGGGYARGTFSATTIGSSQTVTIGAGGSAGASGGAGTGGTGGTTSIGSLLVASGGAGGAGQGAVSAGVSVAGTGGAGSTGQLLISGSVGGVGVSSSVASLGWGGAGGASMLSETNSSPVNGAAVAGQNYGGGASGASTYSNGGAQAGALGAAGIAVITEYIFAPPPLTTTASITWNTVPGTSQSMSASNGYYTTNASATTLTLPTAAAAGTVIEVLGTGAGLWTIAQNASQQIQFGAQNTTVGTGGSIVSTQVGSDIKLVCTTANTTWFATSSIGNLIVN